MFRKTLRRPLSVLLSLLMLISSVAICFAGLNLTASAASVWDGSTKSSGLTLSGRTYYINSANDFAYFLSSIAGGTDYSGKTVVLNTDIDFNNKDTTSSLWPNDKKKNAFSGTFDGQNHSVTNINISQWDVRYDSTHRLGLFRYVKNGTVKNLNLSGSVKTNYCSWKKGLKTHKNEPAGAAICIGLTEGTCTIENIHVTNSEVQGYNRVGGVIGEHSSDNAADLTIRNCTVDANTKISASNADCGGILGKNSTSKTVYFYNCENNADINVNTPAGGMMGYNEGFGYYENCKNTGDMTGTFAGGMIAGENDDPQYFYNCTNTGNITGTSSDAGGIIGQAFSGAVSSNYYETYTEITDSFRQGLMDKKIPYVIGCKNSGTINGQGDNAGGLVGDNDHDRLIYISDCENTGEVKAKNSTGGIIGYNKGFGAYLNCYNTGNITQASAAGGGIVGVIQDDKSTFVNCYNYGDVNVAGLAGGILGKIDDKMSTSSIFTHCINFGSVTSTGDLAGGMMAYNHNGGSNKTVTFTECGNLGNITGYKSAGGIQGQGSYTSAYRCFNTGNIKTTNNSSTYVGGIAGNDITNCEDCFNLGTVSGGTAAAGIVGYMVSTTIKNCYNAGTISGATNNYGVYYNGSNSVSTATNNYMLAGSAPNASTEATKNAADLKNSASILGSNYVTSSWDVSNSYPVLSWWRDMFRFGAEFNANGGTVSGTSSYLKQTYNTSITLPTATKTGYDFSGWYTSASGGTAVANVRMGVTSPMNSGALTLNTDDMHNPIWVGNTAVYYAHWTPTNYTITYSGTDGATFEKANPTSYTIESGSFTLNNPTKAGYTFAGWTGSNGTAASTSVTVPTGSYGNKSYTANFSAVKYTLTLNKYNRTTVSINHYINVQTTLPSDSRTNYLFSGWKVASTDGNWPVGTVFAAGTVENNKYYGNASFNPVFSAIPIITYKTVQAADGFYIYANVTNTDNFGNVITVRAGHSNDVSNDTSSGDWATASSSSRKMTSGTWTVDGTTYAYRYKVLVSDNGGNYGTYQFSLYPFDTNGARFDPTTSSFTFNFTATFDALGGAANSKDVSSSDKYSVTLGTPTKDGYKFYGWIASTSDENGTFSSGTVYQAGTYSDCTGSVKFTAKWADIPVVSEAIAIQDGSKGYKVYANVSGNVSKVKAPSWDDNLENGYSQGDIQENWGSYDNDNGAMTKLSTPFTITDSNGTVHTFNYYYFVDIQADHGGDYTSAYHTHIYAFDSEHQMSSVYVKAANQYDGNTKTISTSSSVYMNFSYSVDYDGYQTNTSGTYNEYNYDTSYQSYLVLPDLSGKRNGYEFGGYKVINATSPTNWSLSETYSAGTYSDKYGDVELKAIWAQIPVVSSIDCVMSTTNSHRFAIHAQINNNADLRTTNPVMISVNGATPVEMSYASGASGYNYTYNVDFTNYSDTFDITITAYNTLTSSGTKTLKDYVPSWKVTYVNGSATNVVSYTYGSGISVPQPTQDGYTFIGWQITSTRDSSEWTVNNYLQDYYTSGTTITGKIGDVNVKAIFAKTPQVSSAKIVQDGSKGLKVYVNVTTENVEDVLAAVWTSTSTANIQDSSSKKDLNDYTGKDKEASRLTAGNYTVDGNTYNYYYYINFADHADDAQYLYYNIDIYAYGTYYSANSADMTHTLTTYLPSWKITFNTDGGSAVSPITYNYNSAVTLPAGTKTAATFTGWTCDTGSDTTQNNWGTGKIAAGNYTNKFGDVNLTGTFTETVYTITYKNIDPTDSSKTETATYTYSKGFTVNSYSNSSWKKKIDSFKVTSSSSGTTWTTGKTYKPGTEISNMYGNVTLEGVWSDKIYTASYVAGYNTVSNEIDEALAKDSSWTYSNGSYTKTDGGLTMTYNVSTCILTIDGTPNTVKKSSNGNPYGGPVSDDENYYYLVNSISLPDSSTGYTVAYRTIGGKSPNEWTQNSGYNCSPRIAIYSTGYDDGTELETHSYVDGDSQHSNLTSNVKASIFVYYCNDNVELGQDFTFDNYQIQLCIYPGNYEPSTVAYGSAFTTMPSPTRVGYTFGGWENKDGKSYTAGSDYDVDGDMVLFAKWNPEDYSYTFVDENGNTLKTGTYNASDGLAMITAASKEGYTFTGWTASENGASDGYTWTDGYLYSQGETYTDRIGNVILKAQYSVNSYTITFLDGNGNTISSLNQDYGTSITYPDTSSYEQDYRTLSWDKVYTTMPAGDVKSQIKYKNNTFTLTYDYTGSKGTRTVTYSEDFSIYLPGDNPESILVEITDSKTGQKASTTQYTYDSYSGQLKIPGNLITGDISVVSATEAVKYVNVDLSGVSSKTNPSNKTTSVKSGSVYHTTFQRTDGYGFPTEVTVTIGGKQIEQNHGYTYDPASGKLTINGDIITGDVKITVSDSSVPEAKNTSSSHGSDQGGDSKGSECPYCGKVHGTGFFDQFIAIIHRILYVIKQLF